MKGKVTGFSYKAEENTDKSVSSNKTLIEEANEDPRKALFYRRKAIPLHPEDE